jgi:hypothetical protein
METRTGALVVNVEHSDPNASPRAFVVVVATHDALPPNPQLEAVRARLGERTLVLVSVSDDD